MVTTICSPMSKTFPTHGGSIPVEFVYEFILDLLDPKMHTKRTKAIARAGRWCTNPRAHEFPSGSPSHLLAASDFGRPSAGNRFNTRRPIATSTC